MTLNWLLIAECCRCWAQKHIVKDCHSSNSQNHGPPDLRVRYSLEIPEVVLPCIPSMYAFSCLVDAPILCAHVHLKLIIALFAVNSAIFAEFNCPEVLATPSNLQKRSTIDHATSTRQQREVSAVEAIRTARIGATTTWEPTNQVWRIDPICDMFEDCTGVAIIHASLPAIRQAGQGVQPGK